MNDVAPRRITGNAPGQDRMVADQVLKADEGCDLRGLRAEGS